ncbi:hypothetical protein NPA07_01090 [Mycoplasmopsis caviae]|uniref:Uncharacterized protein n=1 Tax=Mycoplasmopsis caviae TaxID=55603 RepID=A0A3P8K8R1_9BACT|nr:hypothetical protein [Mycoplasmopsis caviae]UUD35454.1 hypothetical protein NPA07_01090 [Mycoplasmopsis caviae]VDR41769.1 Uncharacterised protein [Mycoplasmopsis caviae]
MTKEREKSRLLAFIIVNALLIGILIASLVISKKEIIVKIRTSREILKILSLASFILYICYIVFGFLTKKFAWAAIFAIVATVLSFVIVLLMVWNNLVISKSGNEELSMKVTKYITIARVSLELAYILILITSFILALVRYVRVKREISQEIAQENDN